MEMTVLNLINLWIYWEIIWIRKILKHGYFKFLLLWIKIVMEDWVNKNWLKLLHFMDWESARKN